MVLGTSWVGRAWCVRDGRWGVGGRTVHPLASIPGIYLLETGDNLLIQREMSPDVATVPPGAALTCLSPVGDGPVHSRLALLSPLFCE